MKYAGITSIITCIMALLILVTFTPNNIFGVLICAIGGFFLPHLGNFIYEYLKKQ